MRIKHAQNRFCYNYGALRGDLNDLHSSNFFEFLNSNTTFQIFSTHQVKITFKHKSCVREPYFICCKRHNHPGVLSFEFLNFFVYCSYIISTHGGGGKAHGTFRRFAK